jgi:uroporphyrinogen-III synthase
MPGTPREATPPMDLPLDGFLIGVTADRRAEEQCEMLRRRGARVLHGPAIRTVPLAPDANMRAATELLIASPPDVLIANTGIGIRGWFAAVESWGLGDELLAALVDTRILARGPKAAGAILTAGLAVAWRSPSERLTEAVTEVLVTAQPGCSVAVQLDGNIEQHEIERLQAAGHRVTEVRVYEWQEPLDAEPALRLLHAVCHRRVDAITFTSAAALHSFVVLAEREGRAADLRTALNGPVLAACVGPVCARAAHDIGLRGRHPERPRLGAMVHWLTAELNARRRHLVLAGTQVVVQGAAITIDGQRVVLTDRERSLFELLLERCGAVVAPPELVRSVWGSAGATRALEVTIARLRRKLGPAGSAIRTVVRRGYRLELDAA